MIRCCRQHDGYSMQIYTLCSHRRHDVDLKVNSHTLLVHLLNMFQMFPGNRMLLGTNGFSERLFPPCLLHRNQTLDWPPMGPAHTQNLLVSGMRESRAWGSRRPSLSQGAPSFSPFSWAAGLPACPGSEPGAGAAVSLRGVPFPSVASWDPSA